MKLSSLLFVILLTAHGALAATWSPHDFAKGYGLELEQQKAIHHLPLPQEVYTTVVLPTLADLRVFNGQGQAVPHLLKMEPTEPSQITEEIDLPFSPLYNIERTGTVRYVERQLLKGEEESGQGGDAGFVQTEREKSEEARAVNGFLVETERIVTTPFRLRIAIGGQDDFMSTLVLEDSDDLTTWSPLGTETLARLNFQGHLIEKGAERPIFRKKKYLRLSWPTGQQDIVIDHIRAVSIAGERPRVRNWTTLAGKRLADDNPPRTTTLEFDSRGFLPVDTIRIGLPRQNSLVQATIKSRPDPNSPWCRRGGGVFYSLETNGTLLSNDTMAIPRTTDRYWRLEIAADQAAASDALPNLQLGWAPHELYLLSQGPGPYILAFGNGAMPADSSTIDNGLTSLLKDIEKRGSLVTVARILGSKELGGATKLLPPPPPIPWKKWLLWAVLVSGVVMIGVMASTLFRQMKEDGRR